MLEGILYIVLLATAVLLVVIGLQLWRALRLFTPPKKLSKLGVEVDLPSVTVCIPARNEQHALAYCLERVVASTYDKLEIIVLDDVSGDDTSALIKSFASVGVRFVKGSPLPEGWLGKNHALQGLLTEASGSYVLFIDVDTRLAPDAIENIVRYALSKRATMVSVLPRREDGWRASIYFSPLRYFWELLFNRKNSPASSSNAWFIRRKVLDGERFQGFNDFKNAIQPEAMIADELSKSNDYRFLVGTPDFGVAYEKKWRSQLITSVRLLFPLLGNRVVITLAAVVDMLVLIAPFIIALSALFISFTALHAIAIALCLVSCVLYAFYTHRVWKHGWLIGALLWPLLLVQEVILVIASAVQYMRKTVTWKGRVIRPEVRN